MKVQSGWLVKIEDIGAPGRIVRVDEKGAAAVVEFLFPEGKVEATLPTNIICSVISRRAMA